MAPVSFQELILPITESPDGSPPVRQWRGAYEQHIGVLLNPPPDVAQDANLYGDYVSLGHLRIVAPLSCLSSAVFALGLMLTARYERRSAPIPNMLAAVVGVALWQGLLIAAYFAVYHAPSLAPLLYIVAIAPAALGAAFFKTRAPRAGLGIRRFAGLPSPAKTREI
jgi:hypothetical protein